MQAVGQVGRNDVADGYRWVVGREGNKSMTDVTRNETVGAVKARGKRDGRVGTVVSDKGDKTIKVRFDFIVKHPKYGKYCKRRAILHSHDEKNEAKVGDLVEITACRRISKTKCWRLIKIFRTAS